MLQKCNIPKEHLLFSPKVTSIWNTANALKSIQYIMKYFIVLLIFCVSMQSTITLLNNANHHL